MNPARNFYFAALFFFFLISAHVSYAQEASLDSWKKVDLSHSFTPGMTVWPGAPGFQLETVTTVEKDGYYMNKYSAGEHLGTHVDAPSHFITGAKNIDELPMDNLIGPLAVIDMTEKAQTAPDLEISRQDIFDWEKKYGPVPGGAFVVVNSGWWKKWNTPEAYINKDAEGLMRFPGFSADAIKYLLETRNIKGVGTDTLSTDKGSSESFDEHRALLGAGKINIENLTNLDQVPPTGAVLVVAPIKIEKGSGAPARVFALVPLAGN